MRLQAFASLFPTGAGDISRADLNVRAPSHRAWVKYVLTHYVDGKLPFQGNARFLFHEVKTSLQDQMSSLKHVVVASNADLFDGLSDTGIGRRLQDDQWLHRLAGAVTG